MWRQIIDFAKVTQKPVILVTDDKKEDWWWKHQGKTIGPRPELIEELYDEAQVLFYMYESERFLEHAYEFLKVEDKQQVIDEVRHLKQSLLFEQTKHHEIENHDKMKSKFQKARGNTIETMIEWFLCNYIDPGNGVPYDGGEGGYQYFNGGPYDALEELDIEFPNVPHEWKDEAARYLDSLSPDWVKIGQY